MTDGTCPACGAADLDHDSTTDTYVCNYCGERFLAEAIDDTD